jgi:hypothetical protein
MPKDYCQQWMDEVRANTTLRTELKEAREDLQTICDAPNARAYKAEAKVKELDKELYHEIVKNNSNVARVEFLEEKVKELAKKGEDLCCELGPEMLLRKQAEADSKRYLEALEKIASGEIDRMNENEYSIAEQAIKGQL